jgi:hypothetical protein
VFVKQHRVSATRFYTRQVRVLPNTELFAQLFIINTTQYDPPNPFNGEQEEIFLILAMFVQVYLKNIRAFTRVRSYVNGLISVSRSK